MIRGLEHAMKLAVSLSKGWRCDEVKREANGYFRFTRNGRTVGVADIWDVSLTERIAVVVARAPTGRMLAEAERMDVPAIVVRRTERGLLWADLRKAEWTPKGGPDGNILWSIPWKHFRPLPEPPEEAHDERQLNLFEQ